MATVGSLAVLAALLVCVVRPPRGLPEVVFAAPAGVLVLASGLEPVRGAWDATRELWPTLAFLAGVFVLAEAADAAGLFGLAGDRLARLTRGSDGRLIAGVAVLAIAVTTVLSLDATVVLFTPVVVGVARGRRGCDAALLVTVLMANGGSTLLPVANLTNLLVVHQTGLGYVPFFVRMVVPAVVAAAVITAVCVGGSRRRLARAAVATAADSVGADHGVGLAPLDPGDAAEVGGRAPSRLATTDGLTVTVGAGLAVVLAGFLLASAAHVAVGWVSCGGALILGAVVLGARRASVGRLGRATSPGFLAFVLGLAIVVDAAARHGLGDWVDRHLPHGTGLGALLGVAILAAILANLVNNLPATLIVLPALVGRPAPVALAALLGLNIGPSLTYTGSLATLLWRKVVRAHGVEPGATTYFATAWTSTVAALPAAVVALWLVTR